MDGTPVIIFPVTQMSMDRVSEDGLVCFAFSDQLPPRGPAGWVDWRLRGRISDILIKRRFAADIGELLLIPSQGHLASKWVLLVGLGENEKFSTGRVAWSFQAVWKEISRLRWAGIGIAAPTNSAMDFIGAFLAARSVAGIESLRSLSLALNSEDFSSEDRVRSALRSLTAGSVEFYSNLTA